MKTIKKALGICAAAGLLSVISYSCCNESLQIIGKGSVNAYEFVTEETVNESIAAQFYLVVLHETKSWSASLKAGFIQSSYAASCPRNFENQLDESTLSIISDRSLTFDGNANGTIFSYSFLRVVDS